MSEVPLQARTGPRRGWGEPASGPVSERGGKALGLGTQSREG